MRLAQLAVLQEEHGSSSLLMNEMLAHPVGAGVTIVAALLSGGLYAGVGTWMLKMLAQRDSERREGVERWKTYTDLLTAEIQRLQSRYDDLEKLYVEAVREGAEWKGLAQGLGLKLGSPASEPHSE